MCLALAEELIVASEGALLIPKVVTDNVQYMGPLGQITRGALTARRVTQSNNPIVWTVEAAALALDISGNLTASKALRATAAGCCYASYCLAPHPMIGMAGIAITNNLLEEQCGA